MAKPDIVCVPGFWEGPACFDRCAEQLRKAGYTVHAASLLSTSVPFSEDPKSPNMHHDVQQIRSLIDQLVNLDRSLILLLHSAGGFLGSGAIKGLTATARKDRGRKGGVIHLAYVAGGVFFEGTLHPDLPCFKREGNILVCHTPRELLFNDVVSDAEALSYVNRLQPQPSKNWNDTVNYAGWKEVPCSYLVCENDVVVPPSMQREFAQRASSIVIESCDAGHMAPITASKAVSDFVRRVAGEKLDEGACQD